VGVQKVRWEGGCTELAGEYAFFYRKGNENNELGTGFSFVYKRILSAVKKVEFVSDRMSYIILRDCWCHIIVLNVHAPTEDTTDDVKDSFYEELYNRTYIFALAFAVTFNKSMYTPHSWALLVMELYFGLTFWETLVTE
jgi:hypothetical protein